MSKKPSDTSTPRDQTPTIYLDENIERWIADRLREFTEWKVEVHRDHFPHSPVGKDESIADTTVIEFCAQRDWLLVSCDDSMRRVPEHNRKAQELRLKAFLFSDRSGGNGEEIAAALIVGRHRLTRFARKNQGPFWARLTRDGEVHHLDDGRRKPHSTAREKTAAKYGDKVFTSQTASATSE